MYIKISKTIGQSIILDVFTYSNSEFIEVKDILNNYGINFNISAISSDKENRMGQRFEINPSSAAKFEKELNIEFRDGKLFYNMSGQPFKCKELSRGKGNGCETIYAKDKNAARLICSSIIAPKNGWFSSYPEEGECKKKGFWG